MEKKNLPSPAPTGGDLIFYQTEDGQTRLQVRLEDETVWLTQKLMAELFQKDVRTINEHIQNVFEEGELASDSVIRKFRIAAADVNLEEVGALNLIVSLYLDFAELQARSRKPMYMHDWIAKLDDFLRVSEREILSHAGRVSHEAALSHAEGEFEKWRQSALDEPSLVEKHFQEAIEQVKQLKAGQAPKRKKKP